MTDSSGALLLAPVAEYRGIALVERRGEKRAVWRGVEYRVDGNIHLLKRSGSDEALEIWTLESEKAAKAVIDSMFEPDSQECDFTDRVLTNPPYDSEVGLGFLSVLDVLIVSKACEEVIADFLQWKNSGGHWEWDDLQEVFVPKSSGGEG